MRPWHKGILHQEQVLPLNTAAGEKGAGLQPWKSNQGTRSPWSARFPAAHRTMTDTRRLNLPGQVPSEGSWALWFGSWNKHWGVLSPVPLAARTCLIPGEKTLKKTSVLTQVHGQRLTPSRVPEQQDTAQVLQSQGCFEMREAKIKTTSKIVSNFPATFAFWTLRDYVCQCLIGLCLPHFSKGVCPNTFMFY